MVYENRLNLRDEDICAIAEAAHTMQRALGIMHKREPYLPEWKLAPDWRVSSTIDSVLFIINNCDQTDTVDYNAELVHNNWVNYKADQGWTYGPEKSSALKTHPCMVPYDSLSREEKVKDEAYVVCVLFLAYSMITDR